jgi:hypothetical protein
LAAEISKSEYYKKLDDFIKWRNSRIGMEEKVGLVPIRPNQRPIMNNVVTESLLRIYANAIGDLNPLWRDSEYGRNSRWGSVIFPPVAEVCVAEYPGWPPMPEIPGWQQHPYGMDRRYFAVLRPGDTFRCVDKEHGINEIPPPNNWPHRVFLSSMSRAFINQRDEIACIITAHWRSVARYPGEEEPIPAKQVHRCTQAELDMYHKAYDEELEGKWRRGSDIRYWENIEVGEELHPLILGPYDAQDAMSFTTALGELAHGYALKWGAIKADRSKMAIDSFLINPETGAELFGSRHFIDSSAQITDRVPLWFNFDCQMEANIAHLITNWMGDDAQVKKLSFKWFGRKFRGDLAFINGKVAKKYIANGEHLVDVEATDDDQDGVRSRTCTATIKLVSKESWTEINRY